MLLKSFVPVFLVSLLAFCACDSNETSSTTEKVVSTKRMRFTRRSTTPIATIETTTEDVTTSSQSIESLRSSNEALNESTDGKPSNDTVESIESSIVTGSPLIAVEIATKKSFRVRNCGERIGDDIPFIAILVHTNPFEKGSAKKKRSFSKGVLISDRFVMATVSSIYHSESFWTVSSVRLGDFVTWNKYASRDKSLSIEVDVEEIFYHKKKDLALIKLKEAVTFTDIIRPACLPISDNYNFKELQSHMCKRSQNKAPADVTLEFAAPLSSFDCKQLFSRKHMTITHQEFCVWDESGDDCTGDIGTPLFTTHNGRLFVIGLRSYAETDDESIDPNEYPGVYVKVGAFLDWITTVMKYDEKNTKIDKL